MYFKEKLLIWHYYKVHFLKVISLLRNSQTLFKILF